jgi:hypothetical protein
MSTFITRWHEVRQVKNSTVVAGLDPAVYEMGRGDKGLPQGVQVAGGGQYLHRRTLGQAH